MKMEWRVEGEGNMVGEKEVGERWAVYSREQWLYGWFPLIRLWETL